MITRKEHMDNLDPYVPGQVSPGHQAYYAQFVNEAVKREVLDKVTLERLQASTDPHMNDIELAVWDKMAGGSGRAHHGDSRVYHRPFWLNEKLIKEAGEGYTLSTGVCILKAAARILIEEHKA